MTPRPARRGGAGRRLSLPAPDWFTLLAGVVSVFIAVLILYPLGRVLADTFVVDGRLNTAPFAALAAQSGLGTLLFNTAAAVGTATLCAVVIGSFFAWLNERTDIGMAAIARILPIVPLLVPPIAGAIGWVLLAAPRSGFVNSWIRDALGMVGIGMETGPFSIFSWPGLIFVYVLYLVPHVYLTVAASLKNLDPSLEEAARISGSSPWAALLNVTLPAIRPAIASGAILALITGFALFSVPVIVGGQAGIDILSVRIVRLMTASYPPQIGVALLLGMVIVLVIGVAWWVQRRIVGLGRFATIGGRGVRVAAVRLGWLLWPARALVILYLLLTSVLPLFALIVVSLQPWWSPSIDLGTLSLENYRDILIERAYTRDGLRNSVVLGVLGATTGMLVAAVIAYFVERNRRRMIAGVIDGTTKLPGAVSNLIIGIAFVTALAGPPFYLHGTAAILFLAYIVLYTPQATISASTALSQVGPQLSEASLMAGASQGTTFARITLPLMVPGLMAGWTLLFVLMAGDITASSMLAGSRNPVAGFVILDLWTNGSFPPLAAIGTVISLMMSTVVLTSLWLMRRRQA